MRLFVYLSVVIIGLSSDYLWGISISFGLTGEILRRLRDRTYHFIMLKLEVPPSCPSSAGRSVRGCRVIVWWWNKKHFSASSFWSFIQFKRGTAREFSSRLQAVAQKLSSLTFLFVNDNKSRRMYIFIAGTVNNAALIWLCCHLQSCVFVLQTAHSSTHNESFRTCCCLVPHTVRMFLRHLL